jgi:hypothetical protein
LFEEISIASFWRDQHSATFAAAQQKSLTLHPKVSTMMVRGVTHPSGSMVLSGD